MEPLTIAVSVVVSVAVSTAVSWRYIEWRETHRTPDEARRGKRAVPEDADHTTRVPDHVPRQVRGDEE